MREKKMFELELVFGNQREKGAGIPTRVEHSGFARYFVPDHVSINAVCLRGSHHAKFAPIAEINRLWKPAFGDAFEFRAIQGDQFSKGLKVKWTGEVA